MTFTAKIENIDFFSIRYCAEGVGKLAELAFVELGAGGDVQGVQAGQVWDKIRVDAV